MDLQIYIHFPFCIKKCLYCDFCSHPATISEVERYCDALEKEIRLAGAKWRDYEVSTVFIGGGTPSVVPAANMEQVLLALRQSFRFAGNVEFTSEANPGTLREEWLHCLMKYGLNRLSLGVQATQERLLLALGRIHTFSQAQEAFQLARRAGVSNVNMDLMYALPGQTMKDWQETLDIFCQMQPEHISAYSLILEEGTPLYDMAESGLVRIPDDDVAADMYLAARETLQKNGYEQYEISNYSKKNMRCRHNVGYWQGAWYLGFGVNASSMLPPVGEPEAMHVRISNEPDTERYIRLMEKEEAAEAVREVIFPKEAAFETVMLGLRMTDGVDMQRFERRFGCTLESLWGKEISQLIEDGLANTDGGFFRLSQRGLLMQNEVLLRLMK